MKNTEFAEIAINIAKNFNTMYMWGTFGAPISEKLISQKSKQYPSWYTQARQKLFRSSIGKNVFAFDCIGLIKGILWGWHGDNSRSYGGAQYTYNGVPDINANIAIEMCKEVSLDFSNIVVGGVVWMPGHIGIYVGEGKVVEATTKWNNKVQITACLNVGSIQGLEGRTWTKHGKLPWIEYGLDEIEALVEELIEHKVITSKKYWIEALRGIRIVDKDSLKAALKNALRGIIK